MYMADRSGSNPFGDLFSASSESAGSVDGCGCCGPRCAAAEVVRMHTELEYWRMHFALEERRLEVEEAQRDAELREAEEEARRDAELREAVREAERRARREAEREAEREERPRKARRVEWAPAADAVEVAADIRTLDQLVAFAEGLDLSRNYLFDKQRLRGVLPALRRLQAIVGQPALKDQVARQVLFFLQSGPLQTMHHTVIAGPPGVGKSTVACVLADLYHGLGLVEGGAPGQNELTGEDSPYPLVVGTRAKMIGQYVGQTVARTQALIDRAQGGVLLIDEAYELGQNETFSQECIDVLNRNLSERARGFICILVGYERELQDKVFARNPGLARRFPFRYAMAPYGPQDLRAILLQRLAAQGAACALPPAEVDAFLEGKSFEFLGGDMETLAAHATKSAARRLFGRARALRVELCDLHEAHAELLRNRKQDPATHLSMYG